MFFGIWIMNAISTAYGGILITHAGEDMSFEAWFNIYMNVLFAGFLLGGAVLTETVFSWPGVGLALYNAISFRDYPIVQGGVLIVAVAFVLVNLFTDLLYAVVDPRIKNG